MDRVIGAALSLQTGKEQWARAIAPIHECGHTFLLSGVLYRWDLLLFDCVRFQTRDLSHYDDSSTIPVKSSRPVIYQTSFDHGGGVVDGLPRIGPSNAIAQRRPDLNADRTNRTRPQ